MRRSTLLTQVLAVNAVLVGVTALIAAIVAEYFGGLQNGLGTRITSAASNTAYPRAWAYVTAACALGLLFYLVTLLVELWFSRHHKPA